MKKIIILLLLLLSTLVVGCTAVKEEDMKITQISEPFCTYSNDLFLLMEENHDILTFASYEDFSNFCTKYNVDKSFSEQFNENYFNENTIIIAFKFDSSSIKTKVKDPEINGNNINIIIEETIPSNKMTMDLRFKGFLIEINKDFYNNNNISVQYKRDI